jgi:hypothetical protein
MGARDKSRFSPKQAGWIALGIFAAWLVFLLVPTPRKAKPAASNELPPMAAQSKLESVGLANNPDWIGLPRYFAIWAEGLRWENGKVTFGYWNPGSQSYSYFFEAIRVSDGYRFRALSRQESMRLEEVVAGLVQNGRESDAHPFVFWRSEAGVYFQAATKPGLKLGNPRPPPSPVKIDLPVKPLPLPPTLPLKDEVH